MINDIENLLPSKEVVDNIIKVEVKDLTKDQVIRFITLVYHNKSPLKNILEPIKRKFEAAKMLDLPRDKNGEFKHESIIKGDDIEFNHNVIKYLRLFKSPEYAMLKQYEEFYYNEMQKLNDLSFGKLDKDMDEKKLADAKRQTNLNLKAFGDTIEELTQKFLMGDNSRQVLQDLYEEMSIEVLLPCPEIVANRLSQKQPPLGNFKPYEF
jgi:hypothetical protein